MKKFIDLFAGIGGFHIAFHKLGLECVFASEIDKHARQTYEKNFRKISPDLFSNNLFNDDILNLNYKEIPDFDILREGFTKLFGTANKAARFIKKEIFKMTKKATVYRMVMDKHICPYGLKSIDLLKTQGYEVEDHHITSREETDAFKEKHDVKTTPQTFIDGERIGGHDDLKEFFGKKQEGTTYKPIIAIFATTLLMALSTAWAIDAMNIIRVIEFFIAISMCVLGIQKLRDLEAFSLQFLNYDLLAQRWVKYGYVYPFVETLAGVAMISGFLTIISAPAALFIGTVGAISVFKAVYIDKRELKCACVGGNSNVPLGFVSLTENLMMIAMSFWMLSKYIG